MFIRKPNTEDLEGIIKVLKYFNFKEISLDSEKIDEEWGDTLTVLNSLIQLDLENAFIAEEKNEIIGFSHYRKIDNKTAETTLLVVNPSFRELGTGKALQEARMKEAFSKGAKKLRTWCSSPESKAWYKKNFNYIYAETKPVHHSIYALIFNKNILKIGLQFGKKEYLEQEIIECDLTNWYADKYNLQWYIKEGGNIFDEDIINNKPLIINAAITGMVSNKEDSINIPLTIEEIVNDAEACFISGARIIHLHARDNKGNPAWEKSYYEKMIYEIRKRCPGIICCVSTSGRINNEFEKRVDSLLSFPDMASLSLGSMNFPNSASINEPTMIKSLANTMKDLKITPECEIFEAGMANYSSYLIKKGILVNPLWFNILLGSLGTMPARIKDLKYLIDLLPDGSNWAATGIGKYQLPINLLSIMMGGHVRVGLEDCLYMDSEKTQLATNKSLISRLTDFSISIGRPIADVEYVNKLVKQ